MTSSNPQITKTVVRGISTMDGGVKKFPVSSIPDIIQRVGDDVIINSSTTNSTKKFKITVDDAGTISATEVTT